MKGSFLDKQNDLFKQSQLIDNFSNRLSQSFDFTNSNYKLKNFENGSAVTKAPESKESYFNQTCNENFSYGDFNENYNNQEVNEEENDSFDFPIIPDLGDEPEIKETDFLLKKEINSLKKQLEKLNHSKNRILDGYQKLQKKYAKLEQDNKFLHFCLKLRKTSQFQSQLLKNVVEQNKEYIKQVNKTKFQKKTSLADEKYPFFGNVKPTLSSKNKKSLIELFQSQK